MILLQPLPQQFLPESQLIDLQGLGINLALVLVMGQVLGWHYVRYAQVLANKQKLARVLVVIAATTLLMISVVKSSFALSLGLVGALSIIRFRTPVKEAEELAYLFLAIAVGVGLGADRRVETSVVFVVILGFMALRSRSPRSRAPLRTVAQITVPRPGPAEGDMLRTLVQAVTPHCQRVELRRVDSQAGEFHASLLVEIAALDGLHAMLDGVHKVLPGAQVSVVERDGLD